ncbi:acylphosphatase [bacterium]|nr:acylphosphatase [bacterium]MBU1983435.1 acylphosphatase [bacterium]
MEDSVCIHVYVSGVVQGVCYRAFVWENARRLGVNGWVRNLPDSRVEAELEGSRSQVNQLLDEMRIGPSMAQVTGVNTIEQPCQGRYNDFRVR